MCIWVCLLYIHCKTKPAFYNQTIKSLSMWKCVTQGGLPGSSHWAGEMGQFYSGTGVFLHVV